MFIKTFVKDKELFLSKDHYDGYEGHFEYKEMDYEEACNNISDRLDLDCGTLEYLYLNNIIDLEDLSEKGW